MSEVEFWTGDEVRGRKRGECLPPKHNVSSNVRYSSGKAGRAYIPYPQSRPAHARQHGASLVGGQMQLLAEGKGGRFRSNRARKPPPQGNGDRRQKGRGRDGRCSVRDRSIGSSRGRRMHKSKGPRETGIKTPPPSGRFGTPRSSTRPNRARRAGASSKLRLKVSDAARGHRLSRLPRL